MNPLLEVRDLSVRFDLEAGSVQAVSDVNFSIQEGEIVGIVGESGSGKSMTALSLLGLLPKPGRISQGEILLAGQNLV
ncbi:MAG: ATP-binding cassette domain-containing protein, partial [Candidatus Dormibacteraceae bacterium]